RDHGLSPRSCRARGAAFQPALDWERGRGGVTRAFGTLDQGEANNPLTLDANAGACQHWHRSSTGRQRADPPGSSTAKRLPHVPIAPADETGGKSIARID